MGDINISTILAEDSNNICVRCLLCENTKDTYFNNKEYWICDECKMAINFVKEMMKRESGEVI